MTRYEQGFMNKCAEYGVKQADAKVLLKNYAPDAAVGALLGGAVGGLATKDKKKKLRNAILMALVGGGGGAALRYGLNGKDISLLNSAADLGSEFNSALDEQGVPGTVGRLPVDILRKRVPFKGLNFEDSPMSREELQSAIDTLRDDLRNARRK